MELPRLLRLTPELQHMIVADLSKYRDLRTLCLTCKQLNDVATPHLYRCVEIMIQRGTKDAILTPGHRGHAHVKDVILRSEDHNIDETTSGNVFMRELLLVLPRNSLRQIAAIRSFTIESDTLALILTQQSMFQSFSMWPVICTERYMPVLRYASMLKNLQKLFVGDTDDDIEFDFYKILLRENRAKLKRLQLSHTPLEMPHGGSKDPFSGLFGTSPNGFRRLIMLEHFAATPLDLTFASRTWAQLIPFETLRFLTLVNCNGLQPFLLVLTHLFQVSGARLQGLVCIDHLDIIPMTELEGLLRSFSGLQHFELVFSYKEASFDCTSLSNHYPTLQSLKLCKGGRSEHTGELFDTTPWKSLEALLENCIELQQLAVAFPAFSTRASKGDYWGDFGQMLSRVSRLPRLSVLHIITWPVASSRGKPKAKVPTLVEYEEDMKLLACRILARFEAARSSQASRLRLLAFGNALSFNLAPTEKTRKIVLDDRRFYARMEQLGSTELSAPTMMSIKPTEIERHVSGFDVLGKFMDEDIGIHNGLLPIDIN